METLCVLTVIDPSEYMTQVFTFCLIMNLQKVF